MSVRRHSRLDALTRVLLKVKNGSVAELRERAGQSLTAALERRGFAGSSGEPPDRALWSNLDARSIAGAADADALRTHFRAREAPRFFDGVRDGSSGEALRTHDWEWERVQLLSAADRMLDGRFDVLGYTDVSYGTPIDWYLDPMSGKRGLREHWSRITYQKFLDDARVGDHKVIWEINRHQQFMVLGRAWQVTRDPRYAQCFVEQVMSWMDANAPKQGFNWASTLEVSYRAIAWVWAIELFRDAPDFTADVLARMLKYLLVHGRHLERYLSTYFSPNTHLTGEALGLLYLGTMLPELKPAARWRARGWTVLEDSLPKQIYPDGVYFEQATYYHRYTTDIYLHAAMLAQLHGVSMSAPMRERLTLAIEHLADITRADGTIPIIGDDDGGRLVALETRRHMDVRAVLITAALVLERPEFATVAGAVTEEVLWLHGPAGVQAAKRLTATQRVPDHTSKLFPIGGYGVMRDGWGKDALHAVIDSGPHGALASGHSHADALSVELSAGGCALIVDPGTYIYSSHSAARDKFRHTAAHNSVTLGGEASSVPSGIFSWAHSTDARIDHWWSGSVVDRFVGSHTGFERLDADAVHSRALWFVRGSYWVIVDDVLGTSTRLVEAHFHAALGAEVEQRAERSAILKVPCKSGWRRLFFGVAGDVEPIHWSEDWVSPAYGSRGAAPYARVRSSGHGARQLVSVLCPQGEFEAVFFQEFAGEVGRTIAVSRQTAYDQFLLPASGLYVAEGIRLTGDGAFIRRSREGGAVESIALFGAKARLETDTLIVDAAGAMEAVRANDGWRIAGEGRITIRP